MRSLGVNNLFDRVERLQISFFQKKEVGILQLSVRSARKELSRFVLLRSEIGSSAQAEQKCPCARTGRLAST
jgi:hypothetical protein